MTKTHKSAAATQTKASSPHTKHASLGKASKGSPEANVTWPKRPSKQQQLAALVVRDAGATLEQMIAATGWLPHTTRAALTGLRKKGFIISSDKVEGVRTYRGIAPE
jgi:hypothetical protein